MIKKFKRVKWYKTIKKSGLFDEKYYLFTYPDIRKNDINPIKHYINIGASEGRNPSQNFDTKFYLDTYADVKKANINPLVHYVVAGKEEGRNPMIKKVINEIKMNGIRSATIKIKQKIKSEIKQKKLEKNVLIQSKEKFVDYKENEPLNMKLKTIAFYLPQFHPFLENDKWWGKGFTEWTNVSKAKPNFKEHYQPHLPIHNGFYDLRVPEVMIDQAKLAKNYGINGFNFYYYWFDGKILMHKPFEILLEHKEIDIDFCITWANENWTRRWDGNDNEILIGQKHSREDSIKFLKSLYKYFEDDRYIRVDNKPVLIIYRADIIPNMKDTITLWRQQAAKAGFDGIYLICVQAFGAKSPNKYGFDAAMEFPPHSLKSSEISKSIEELNDEFNGIIYDYEEAATNACTLKEPEYKLFRTAMLSWDNTARKQNTSVMFENFSLQRFKEWVSLIKSNIYSNDKYSSDEKLIFINAWNEWAEGTHLEPDRKFGYGYLQNVYDALKNNQENRKIIIVSHDAHPHGAQYLALNIAKYLKEYFRYEVVIVINGTGDLVDKFQDIGSVFFTKKFNEKQKNKLFKSLFERGFHKAIANTSVVGDIVKDLTLENIKVVSLIHEMKSVIETNKLQNSIKQITKYANKIVFPSEIVKKDFEYFEDIKHKDTHTKPQGLFRENQYKYKKEIARKRLLKELKIEENSKVILNIAYGDERKGIDIFAEVGEKLIKNNPNIHFVWVGHFKVQLVNQIMESLKKENIEHNFHFVGLKEDIAHYYAGSDIFFLSSREDPFPSVVLDAMNVGLPVVAFEGAGGFTDIVFPDCGLLADINNLTSASGAISRLLNDKKLYNSISINAVEKIEKDFSFTKYLFSLLQLQNENIKKISVIIPNYNYEKYIKSRLESILNQTYPIYEIIYLDDNSSDNSLEIAKKVLRESNIPFKIIKNETNSGSVFKQWAKGMSQADGDYLWIAESDDLCDKNFLENVVRGFSDSEVVLSYCQSKMIDAKDNVTAENYFDYTNDISTTKWKKNYINDGIEELKTAMVVKNTIPNVSSVVFKKFDISQILDELCKFKVAGDWYVYTYLLQKGKISYCSESLNMHRRHNNSVTVSKENNKNHYSEIVYMQNAILNNYEVSNDISKLVLDYRKDTEKFLLGYKGTEKKKIIIHIGFGKTGTTSIQDMLKKGINLLMNNSILYPRTGFFVNGHHHLANMNSISKVDVEIYQKLVDEINNSSCNTTIISSEQFIFVKPEYVSFIAKQLNQFNIEIIFYIRRQDKLIESSYLQFLKIGNKTNSFKKFFQIHKDSFNFMQRINPWIENFGVAKITARLFDKQVIGDVRLDFMNTIKLNHIKLDLIKEKSNPSLLPELEKLVQMFDINESIKTINKELDRINAQFVNSQKKLILSELINKDINRKKFIDKLLDFSRDNKSFSKYKLCDSKIKKEINDYYLESNKLFAETFLSRLEKDILCKK